MKYHRSVGEQHQLFLDELKKIFEAQGRKFEIKPYISLEDQEVEKLIKHIDEKQNAQRVSERIT